jgi:hypothetical protein
MTRGEGRTITLSSRVSIMIMAFAAVLIDVGGTLCPDKWPPTVESLYKENLKKVFPGAADDAIDRLWASYMPVTQEPRTSSRSHKTHPAPSAMLWQQLDSRGAGQEAVLQAMDIAAGRHRAIPRRSRPAFHGRRMGAQMRGHLQCHLPRCRCLPS